MRRAAAPVPRSLNKSAGPARACAAAVGFPGFTEWGAAEPHTWVSGYSPRVPSETRLKQCLFFLSLCFLFRKKTQLTQQACSGRSSHISVFLLPFSVQKQSGRWEREPPVFQRRRPERVLADFQAVEIAQRETAAQGEPQANAPRSAEQSPPWSNVSMAVGSPVPTPAHQGQLRVPGNPVQERGLGRAHMRVVSVCLPVVSWATSQNSNGINYKVSNTYLLLLYCVPPTET